MADRFAKVYFDRYVTKPGIPAPVNAYVGRERVMYDEFELSSVLAVGDKIKVGRLPKGARVLDCKVAYDALGGTAQFDLGYLYLDTDPALVSDDNAFIDSQVGTASGSKRMDPAIVGFGQIMLAEADLELTFDVASANAVGKIRTHVTYVID